MPIYTYRQFTPDSDDMNRPGSSDITKPSEGWKGRDANDALRATNSALRNLGDEAAKLPRNADGSINYGPNGGDGRLGTAAFQNTDSFQITTGILGPGIRGSVGGNTILPVVCGFSDFPFFYQEQRTRGFDVCDGRQVTNPYAPFNVVKMPDYRGLYLWMVPDPALGGTVQFQDSNRRISVSPHNHGNTGDVNLDYINLPPVVTSVTLEPTGGSVPSDGTRLLSVVTQGRSEPTSRPHAHTTASALAFQPFDLNVRPPSIGVFFFLRVW